MHSARFLPQEISALPRILVYPSSTSLAKEIIRQLRQIGRFEILLQPDSQPVDVYICIRNPKTKSLSVSASKKIEIDPVYASQTPEQSAAEIISKFYYHYRLPRTDIAAPKNKNRKSFLYFLLIPFLPYLLYLLQTLFLVGFVSCSLKLGSEFCSSSASKLSSFMLYQLPIVPGVNGVATRLGFPPELTASVLKNTYLSTRDLLLLRRHQSLLFQDFFTTGVNSQSLDKLPFLTTSAVDSLSYLQLSLKDLYLSSRHPPTFLETFAGQVDRERKNSTRISVLMPDLPNLLGMSRRLTYLILLQDHAELRPTGGYLDSFILATVENGRLIESQAFSTRLSDAQLNGVVEPPPLFKQVTNTSAWYMRDSNWDPDFFLTAQRAAWFVSKEQSRTVDVVIGLNSQLIPKEKYLSAYLSRIKQSSETGVSSLIKLFQENKFSLDTLLSGLESGQVLVAPQTFSSRSLEQLGWSGGVASPFCSGQNCVGGYLYAVDTNLGQNKSDFYLSRSSQMTIKFTENRLDYHFRHEYRNNSPDATWPAGTHKNFLRTYLPPQLTVDRILINNRELAPSQYSLFSDHGLIVLGIMLDTAPLQTSIVEVAAHQKLAGTSFHYQLVLPRQPGVPAYPFELSLQYPSLWQVVSYQTPSVASTGTLRYNMSLSAHQTVSLDFILP